MFEHRASGHLSLIPTYLATCLQKKEHCTNNTDIVLITRKMHVFTIPLLCFYYSAVQIIVRIHWFFFCQKINRFQCDHNTQELRFSA